MFAGPLLIGARYHHTFTVDDAQSRCFEIGRDSKTSKKVVARLKEKEE